MDCSFPFWSHNSNKGNLTKKIMETTSKNYYIIKTTILQTDLEKKITNKKNVCSAKKNSIIIAKKLMI